ncbi:MAG: Nif-specific regulatory protein [Deltaproteobacteria bacterium]|nr:Nif-specific regulatory protein [Deltaproteobacteria bacterium]
MAPAEKEEDKKIFSRLNSLYEISKLLGSSIDLHENFPRVFSILAQQMGMKRGGLLLRGDESSGWEMKGCHGLSAEELKRRKEYFGSGIIQKILEKGQMAAVVDSGETCWFYDGKSKPGLKRAQTTFLCAPVKMQGAITGIVGVDHFYEEPVAITEDFNLLGEICSLISGAMLMRKDVASDNRALLEENWSFRKELENLGRSVPKARRKISLTEILEERLARMIAEMKVDPRSHSQLYDEVLNVVERTLLKSALEKTKHVQLKTARFLGINRNTLRRKMKEFGIITKGK